MRAQLAASAARVLGLAALFLATAAMTSACGGSEVPAPTTTQGLVAHYELNGDSSDRLGSSPGTMTGAVAVADRHGNDAGALRFNGQDAYIEIAHTDALNLQNEFTIAAWVLSRPSDNTGEFWTIIEKSDPERGGHSRYGLWLRDGLLWTCYEVVDNSEQPCANTTVELPVGEWHHIAAVRSGRRALLYIDGQQVVDSFVGNRDISQTSFSAFIGSDRYEQPAAWLDADLDDLRIYDRPLPADEINELATS